MQRRGEQGRTRGIVGAGWDARRHAARTHAVACCRARQRRTLLPRGWHTRRPVFQRLTRGPRFLSATARLTSVKRLRSDPNTMDCATGRGPGGGSVPAPRLRPAGDLPACTRSAAHHDSSPTARCRCSVPARMPGAPRPPPDAGPSPSHLVLQVALAALVADGAVQRVVDQQKLHHSLPCLLHQRRVGLHVHARPRRHRARCHRLGALLDLRAAAAAGARRRASASVLGARGRHSRSSLPATIAAEGGHIMLKLHRRTCSFAARPNDGRFDTGGDGGAPLPSTSCSCPQSTAADGSRTCRYQGACQGVGRRESGLHSGGGACHLQTLCLRAVRHHDRRVGVVVVSPLLPRAPQLTEGCLCQRHRRPAAGCCPWGRALAGRRP